MATASLYTLASVFLVSLLSLSGVFFLSAREVLLRKYIFVFISIAVGALLGDAFIHLIPEALETASDPLVTSLGVIGGILAFFVLEKLLHWHHHDESAEVTHIHPVGRLILLSDGLHNFLDGLIIAASFAVSIPVGVATTVAVILHEIPQEVGDFAILLHSGYTRLKALLLNLVSALTSFLGAAVFFLSGEFTETLVGSLLPFVAGGFIYIALADLLPELRKHREGKSVLYQFLAALFGILIMIALAFLE